MANKRNFQREGQGTHEHAHTHVHKKSLGKERQQNFRDKKKHRLEEVTNLINTTIGDDSLVNLERSTSRVAEHFAIQWYEQTTTKRIEFQRLLLLKTLKHPIWEGVMLSHTEMGVCKLECPFLDVTMLISLYPYGLQCVSCQEIITLIKRDLVM
jgi:hypothetical protein